jgi:hypothetical protein
MVHCTTLWLTLLGCWPRLIRFAARLAWWRSTCLMTDQLDVDKLAINIRVETLSATRCTQQECAFNHRFPRLLRYQPMVRSLCLDTRCNARRFGSALVSRGSRDPPKHGAGVDTATASPCSALSSGSGFLESRAVIYLQTPKLLAGKLLLSN